MDEEPSQVFGTLEIHPYSGPAIPVRQDLPPGRFRGELGEHSIEAVAGLGVADRLLGAGKGLESQRARLHR
jgi:hypothetical protein